MPTSYRANLKRLLKRCATGVGRAAGQYRPVTGVRPQRVQQCDAEERRRQAEAQHEVLARAPCEQQPAQDGGPQPVPDRCEQPAQQLGRDQVLMCGVLLENPYYSPPATLV